MFVLISLTCVSASDNQTIDNATIASDAIDDEVIGETYGSFSNLQTDIANSDNELKLTIDYEFKDDDLDNEYRTGIVISKNDFVLDGQGCTISGANLARIIRSTGHDVTLKNINFVNGHLTDLLGNDVPDGFGGAIMGSGFTVIGCTFTNNYNSAIYASDCNITGCTFNNNFGTNGGALFLNQGNCKVEDCTFNNNSATYGGAIFKNGNPHEKYVCTILDSIFNDNNATVDGGALYSNGTNFAGPVITGVGCNFTGNSARQNGGAVCGNGSYELCVFNRNSARQGGAVYDSYLIGCTFNGNKADDSGGAVYADYVYYSTFVGNSANRGGAFRGSYANNCTFIRNSANKGGAMEGEKIVNCTFTNNSASESGGGIHAADKGLVIQGCNFTGNVAKKGAAAYCAYSITCSDSVLLNNKADANSIDADDADKSLSFKFNGNNDMINALSSSEGITLSNVTYWNGSEVNSGEVSPNRGASPGINVKLEIYMGDNLVKSLTFITDGNGKADYDYAGLDFGKYTYKAYHEDDSYYTYAEKTGEFRNLANSTVNVDIIGNPVSGMPLEVNVYGINLTKIDVIIYDGDGKAVFNIVKNNPKDSGTIIDFPALTAGQYNITVINQVNDTVNSSQVSKLFNVSGLFINASDAIYFIGSSMIYQAKLIDDEGNPVFKQIMTFIINNDVHYGVTDKNGIAKVHLDLEKGDYDVLISHDSALNVTAKISVLLRLVENNNLVMDYNLGSFKVRAIGDDGKPIAGDYVKISVDGKTYNVKTNNQGYAILKITSKPNTYQITSTYKGYSVQNTIKVKKTLSAKKTFKAKKNRKLTLTATLKRSNGKAISGKKVLFKLNGKTYKATTNKKGIAKVTIKSKVVKKLKVGKKYALKISYIKQIVNSKVIVKK